MYIEGTRGELRSSDKALQGAKQPSITNKQEKRKKERKINTREPR
jgi:hypothetical protein